LTHFNKIDNQELEWEEQVLAGKSKFIDACLGVVDEGGTRIIPQESIKKGIKASLAQKPTFMLELMTYVSSMQVIFENIKIEANRAKQDIIQRFQSSIFSQSIEEELELRFTQEEEEIKRRHQRELEAFKLKCERERIHLAETAKIHKRQVLALTTALKRKQIYCKYQAESDATESIKKYIQNSLPVINYRYQLGSPLSHSTTSVFRGLDLNTAEFIAIKALPAEINLDTSLKHETLVPVLDVCSANSTLFVVMKLMKENLFEFVARLPDQKLEPFQTAYIIHTVK
jgi:hypothetical protein